MSDSLNGPEAAATQARRVADPHVPLHAILSALPQGTMLPAGWVLERISGHGSPSATGLVPTLSAQEFGDRRVPRRSADWVRQECAAGRIEGAVKDGGEWRIPVSALSLPIPSPTQQINAANRDAASMGRPAGASIYPRWRRESGERAR